MNVEADDRPDAAPPAATEVVLGRVARLFSGRPGLIERLGREAAAEQLADKQIFRPGGLGDVVVRLGRLRVSEFLPDGREVCRAVLQSGSYLEIRPAAETDSGDAGSAAAGRRNAYPMTGVVLMALGRTELWILPPGTLRRNDV